MPSVVVWALRDAEDFIETGKFYRTGHSSLMIDILPEISGVDFNRLGKAG